MSDDEILEELRTAVKKQRGYAGFYHWHGKRQKEAGILESFVEGARRVGILLTDTRLEDEGKDPPDGWTHLDSRKIAIELTEFVDESLVAREKRTGDPQWRYWVQTDFTSKVTKVISTKDHSGFGKTADFWLVIHSDEPALSASLVEEYCAASGTIETSGLDRCFMLLSYDPQIESYPVLEVPVRRAS